MLPAAETPPAGHDTQVDDAVAPDTAEYVFTPQSTHDSLPVVDLYLPDRHVAQAPPSGPVVPGPHLETVQALKDELPIGDVVPAGQDGQ